MKNVRFCGYRSASGFNPLKNPDFSPGNGEDKRFFEKRRCKDMANIKSAKKRILVTDKKTARNKSIRSKVKTSIKKVEAAVEAGDKEAASAALKAATSEIDRAQTKGVYHKNNASRKVSRLAQLVNTIE